MNTLPSLVCIRSALVVLAVTAALSHAVSAADAPAAPADASGVGPVPIVTIYEVKKGDDKIIAGETGRATGAKTFGGQSNYSNGPKIVSTKGQARYLITVRNASKFAAKNLEVEYHIYNRTVSTANGVAGTPGCADITKVVTIDSIDPGTSKTIETEFVPHENTQIQTPAVGPNSRPSSSSTVTSVLGWHVEVRFNGKVLKPVSESPSNLPTLLKPYDFGR